MPSRVPLNRAGLTGRHPAALLASLRASGLLQVAWKQGLQIRVSIKGGGGPHLRGSHNKDYNLQMRVSIKGGGGPDLGGPHNKDYNPKP